ncbi:MAG: GntR family transcriptional regulator [Lachnoanaerobaculum sp.]|jgi:transcriptional regulator, gntR family|uniref:GntR family transcriptional regulator n=1 Tax=Lachnoanaerobaculum TaxID=1164882 RepID=UPI00027A5E20|nr:MULTISPECIES: GntR family transcriptional regulator [unclassified Lachnoanaerobaculum]EJP22103.1 transcriptional regulator [Lachnoanaerobaculum sp. ICM7]MBS5881622.1 GntR family transcriptional regulator [Lachnoanaerobaculum sp.]GMO02372.1 GntR family transcriptional regulator [Lachnoanaerobaculum sp. JCM 36186]
MIVIDSRDKRAIYEQVMDRLSDLMLIGALEPGDKLPSVRSLAVELSINPNTIQKAYIELERQGYVYSVKGVGSFVADMDVIKENKKSIIYKELEELVDKSRKIISKEEFCKKVEEFYPEHKAKEGA